MSKILNDILLFQELTDLSDYRTGYILAKNGQLVQRIKNGGDITLQTGEKIRAGLEREVGKRKLNPALFHSLNEDE